MQCRNIDIIKAFIIKKGKRIYRNKIMRRSSKQPHLITSPGQDQTYRFRCMQYLNFVLDQVVNQQNRFKLYSSHIEHLLRNNLNDITIQDIEKIKRMLDEGEKQKVQTQQTGDFINYDLIEKMKYSHDRTHYYLQQAPQQSLLEYYGPNDHTIQEVQQIKNRLRQQKLNENNYKMLDLMFKLPEDYQNLQDQIQKEIQKQQEHQLQIMKQENQKMLIQLENEIANDEIVNKLNDANNVVQEIAIANEIQKSIVVNQVDNKAQQNINQIKQSNNQNIIFSTPQKQNITAPKSQPSLDIPFAQIKKKKSNKKKPPLSQKPINQPIDIRLQQPVVKQDKKQQNASLIQNDQDENIQTASPQKRKYIRKKPLQPKKAKSEKSKSGEKESQNKESELFEKKLQLEGEVRQSNEKQIIVNPKKSSQQKQKRPKKVKKPDPLSKKPSGVQQLQIVLPFPQCQQQVRQLKRQLQELNKRLQNEKQQFLQNRQHALELLTRRIRSGEIEQVKENNQNMEKKECKQESQELHKKENIDVASMKENEQKQEIKVHGEINNNNELIIMPEIVPKQQQQQQVKKQKTKKPKAGWKPSVLKKQSKKSSSQQYKPPQDEIESVYEIEKDGKMVLVDDSCDKKKSKKQRKKDNKRAIHGIRKKNFNKGNQQCVVLQAGTNKMQPSQQIINSNINNNNVNNEANNNITLPLQIPSVNPPPPSQAPQHPPQGKQKKSKLSKLSLQQRQRIKQQKQKLKQMRQRQKQQKKKLKQLQKLQKGTLKLTHKVSEKSSAKENKSQTSTKKATANTAHIKAINQFKKQPIQMKIDNPIQQPLVDDQLLKRKNILDESIGMNSTKEDIRIKSQSLQFAAIAQQQQQQNLGLKREQPISNLNKVNEQDLVLDITRKKLKQLQCKQLSPELQHSPPIIEQNQQQVDPDNRLLGSDAV